MLSGSFDVWIWWESAMGYYLTSVWGKDKPKNPWIKTSLDGRWVCIKCTEKTAEIEHDYEI